MPARRRTKSPLPPAEPEAPAPSASAAASSADPLAALIEVARALNASPDLDGALTLLIDTAIHLAGADRGLLALCSEASGDPDIRLARDGRQKTLATKRVEADHAILRQAIESGRPIVAPGGGKRTILAIPLKARGGVLGALYLESGAGADRPGERVQELLAALADMAALAWVNARLAEAQQREVAEALREIGAAHSGTLEMEAVLDRLLDHVARVVPCDAACLLLVDEATGRASVVRQRGYEQFGEAVAEAIRRLSLDIARTPNLRRMAETGGPLVVPNSAADPGWVRVEAASGLRSWVGAPVVSQGRVIAFFSLDKAQPGSYRSEHADRLALFAGQAALALQNAQLYQDTNRRAAELEAIRQASLSLTSSLDLQEVLDAILRSVLKLASGAQDAHIFLFDSDTERLTYGAALLADGRRGSLYSEPRPNGLTYTVARQGRAVVVPDMRTHPLFADAPHDWRGAIIGFPLKIGARVVGVMNVAYTQPHPAGFEDAELRVLQLLGDQAASVIENARLFEATRRQLRELTALHALTTAVVETTTEDELIERATQVIGEMLYPDNFGVLMLNEAEGILLAHPSYRLIPKDAAMMRTPVPLGQGVTGQVALTGRAWRVPDVSREPNYFPSDPQTQSELCVPLKVDGRVVGVVNAESRRVAAFSEADERLLTTLAGQLATAMEKLRLFEAEGAARQQAETLREVAATLSTTLDRDQLLHLILEQLARVVTFDSASIMLVLGDALNIVAHQGFQAKSQFFSPVEIKDLRHLREVLDTRQPIIIPDTRADPRWRYMPGTDYLRCWLGVPLLVRGRVLGLLNLDYRVPGFYTERHAELALAFAHQAAVALERLRLLDETQRREMEMATLLEVARAVSSSLDLDEVLLQVARPMARALRLDRCALSTYDPDRRAVSTLAVYSVHGQLDTAAVDRVYPLDDYPAKARVIESDDVLLVRVADPQADPVEVAGLREAGDEALLMLSLRAGGRPVGLAELSTADGAHVFTSDDLHLARVLADHAGVAVANAQLFRAEQEQRELAEALRQVGATLSGTLDFDAVLDRLLDQIARVVPYDTACIMLVEEGRARVARLRGYEKLDEHVLRRVENFSFDIQSTPNLRRMVETREPLVIADVAADPEWVAFDVAAHIRSWAGAPIVLRSDGVVAFFSLDKVEPNFYRPRHAERLSAFAAQAALALQNARLFEAERQRVAALTALHETGLDLSAHLDLPTLLRTIVERAARLLEAPMGGLYLVLPDGQTLEMVVSYQFSRDFTAVRLRLGEGLSGQVAQTGEPLVVHNYQAWPGRAEVYKDMAWGAVVGVPVKWRGQVLGVINITDDRPYRFDPADVELLRLFADQAAVAIVNARLFDESRRKTQELSGLYNTALVTSSVLETEVLLTRLYEQVRQLMSPDTFVVALYHPETDELEVALAVENDELLPSLRLPLKEGGLTGWVIRMRQPLMVGDLQTDPLPVEARHITTPARSWLGVPLTARDQLLGVVSVQSFRPHAFGDADQRFLESVAVQVAIALENAHLYADVSAKANELGRLYAAAQDMGASLEPGAVLEQLAKHLTEALNATSAYVMEANLREGTLTVLAEYWAEAATPSERVSDLGRIYTLRDYPATAQAIARAETLNFHADTPGAPEAERLQLIEYGVKSALLIPVVAHSRVLGTAEVWESRRRRVFTPAEERLARTLVRQAAGALENAQLFKALADEKRRLELLYNLSRNLMTSVDPRQVATTALDLISAASGALRGMVFVTQPNSDRLRLLAMVGADPETIEALDQKIDLHVGEGLAGSAAAQRRLTIAVDVTRDPRWTTIPGVDDWVRSAVSIPLIAGDELTGVLDLHSDRPSAFRAEHVPLLTAATVPVAAALQNARLFEEARQHADEMMAASEILRALNATPDVNEAFPAMVTGLKAISRCERLSLALLDESWEWVTMVALDQPRPELGLGTRFPVSATAAAVDVLGGRAHLTPDLAAEADFQAERTLYEAGYRSRINLPLRVGPTVIGSLNLVWREPAGYGQANLRLLGQIADAVALAVEKNRLFTETRRRADELGMLVSVSSELRAASTGAEMLPIFLQKAAEVLGPGVYTIFLIEPATGDLIVRGCHPPDPEVLGLRYRAGRGIAGHVAATGERHIAEDVTLDRLAHLLPEDAGRLHAVRSSLALPLRTQEQIVGVLHVGLYERHAFSENELGLLTAIAEIAGNALHRASVMETLEQRVAERTRALAEANERLKELDRLKDQFVSSVSHELRTPLTNIKLHLGLLDKRGPDALERYLPILLRETERLRRLIEDLLDLSRLQAQALPPQREKHRLDALLAEVIAVHTTRAEAKGLTLRHEPNPNVREVPMDRAQMIQVFTNLIGNAVAYTPAGGRVAVTSTLSRDGPKDGVLVRVHNDGPPIPEEDLPHLFERFYRGRTGRDSGEPGTGLGLAICKDIVERHGGFVDVESAEPVGTTFQVWLPLAPEAEPSYP